MTTQLLLNSDGSLALDGSGNLMVWDPASPADLEACCCEGITNCSENCSTWPCWPCNGRPLWYRVTYTQHSQWYSTPNQCTGNLLSEDTTAYDEVLGNLWNDDSNLCVWQGPYTEHPIYWAKAQISYDLVNNISTVGLWVAPYSYFSFSTKAGRPIGIYPDSDPVCAFQGQGNAALFWITDIEVVEAYNPVCGNLECDTDRANWTLDGWGLYATKAEYYAATGNPTVRHISWGSLGDVNFAEYYGDPNMFFASWTYNKTWSCTYPDTWEVTASGNSWGVTGFADVYYSMPGPVCSAYSSCPVPTLTIDQIEDCP